MGVPSHYRGLYRLHLSAQCPRTNTMKLTTIKSDGRVGALLIIHFLGFSVFGARCSVFCIRYSVFSFQFSVFCLRFLFSDFCISAFLHFCIRFCFWFWFLFGLFCFVLFCFVCVLCILYFVICYLFWTWSWRRYHPMSFQSRSSSRVGGGGVDQVGTFVTVKGDTGGYTRLVWLWCLGLAWLELLVFWDLPHTQIPLVRF